MGKKSKKITIFMFFCIGIILLLTLVLFYLKKEKQPKMIWMNEEPELWIITDTHFLSKSLHDNGAAFEKFNKTTVGKDILYSEDLLQAFVKKVLQKKPDGIVITGDVTLNGEKKSLVKMSKLFEPLKKANIPVLAIPGNHDIHDGWAREFVLDKQFLTDEITPFDFKKYLPDGYRLSHSQDDFSLSYTVDIGKYRLFLMDSNLYTVEPSQNAPITQGRFKKETLAWLEKELIQGKKEKKVPLLFSHHNILSHSKRVYKGFVLNNAEAVLELVKKYEIPLAFSGHIHAQDILKSKDIPTFYEVVTSAFSLSESHIGRLTLGKESLLYQGEIFDPRPYFSNQQLQNPDLKNYPTYLKSLFLREGSHIAYKELFSQKNYDDNIVDPIATLSGEINLAYFVGKVWSKEEKEALKQEKGYQLMQEYAPNLEKFILDKINRNTTQDPMYLKLPLKKEVVTK